MKKASREIKRTTLLSNCKNTANTYKSTISQDNNHPAKFKLTQEKKMKWQFQSYIDKINWHIRQTTSTSAQSKNGNVRKRDSIQTEIECDHSMGNDKSQREVLFNPLSPEPIIVQHQIIWSWYTGRWWVACYIWYSEEGTGRGPSQGCRGDWILMPIPTPYPQ